MVAAFGVEEAAEEVPDLEDAIRRQEAAQTATAAATQTEAAYGALARDLARLRAAGAYREGAEKCRTFLTAYSDSPRADDARRLARPFELVASLLDALPVAGRARVGTRLPGLPDPIAEASQEAIVFTAGGGSRRSLNWRELPAPALAALAAASGLTAPASDAALALFYDSAGHQADAYEAARRALAFDVAPCRGEVEEVERRALYSLAELDLRQQKWEAAIGRLQRLQAEHSQSDFYQKSQARIQQMLKDAGHQVLLARGMILVPAGRFIFQNRGSRYLPAFYMDKTEVTNAEYAEFLRAVQERGDAAFAHSLQAKGKSHVPLDWTVRAEAAPHEPVVGADWFDAYAYARWKGARLPTEEEWEKAARGADGRKYPWGNSWDPARCNSAAARQPGRAAIAPVGSYPAGASPYGALDMTGNAREWTASSPPGDVDKVVLRGGSYLDAPDAVTTIFRREYPRTARDGWTGFRCCRGAP
jgi:formylglycine-generating enzyme required for sulfatase activity